MRCSRGDFLPIVSIILKIIFHISEVLTLDEVCNNVVQNWSGRCVNARTCGAYNLPTTSKAADFLRNNFCYYAGRDPVICCPSQMIWQQPPVTQRPTVQPSYEPSYDVDADTLTSTLYKPYCGFSGIKRYKVVGGQPAPLGAWPWIAALGYKNPDNPKTPKWLCGGSLISGQHILTAGHCVYNRTDLYVARLGEHDITSTRDGANPVDVAIILGVIHPGYSHVNFVNDIAVLKLKHFIHFTNAIHPICLPLPTELRYKDYTGSFPFIAGWGALYFHGPTSAVLQEVQLPVVPEQVCKRAFAPFEDQVIDDRVMCAGYTAGGKDSCKGDSGGPLMTPFNQTYYLIGVVSYGYRCAEPGIPGVYTKVSYFLDFILKNLK